MVKEGKYKEALEIIMQDLPLPGVIGRICPHECEDACRRAEIDAPVAIRDLKRLAADMFDPRQIDISCLPERKERVAIIGSGPAGLSAAYHLAKRGIRSTIFEALSQAGGMLRVGIPQYRLPVKVLDNEIGLIEDLGVEIKTNSPLGPDFTMDDLFEKGFKAVYLALGAHKGIELGIPGERSAGVRQGVDFLREANLAGKTEVGSKVAVIGGGNVAIDVARSAVRLGAGEVTIVYRRTRAEMPAWEEELQAAEAEGVRLVLLSAPVEVLTRNDRVIGLRCIRMELGEPDESGRRRPVPVPGTEYDMDIDQVIAAIGQRPDLGAIEGIPGIEITRWGTIQVDPVTYATGREGVFAGGDVQSGPGIAISAIAAGREAAESICRYLDGMDIAEGRQPKAIENPVYRPIPKHESVRARARMRRLPPEERKKGFMEVELGLDEDTGKEEAARCLNCGYCCECFQCVEACSAGAVTLGTHAEQAETIELEVGSIILAPGFQAFDPSRYTHYRYAKHPNVVTSIEFERILSATGPTQGRLLRPSDRREPAKIAWLQCVGSRDVHHCDHGYCSSVCCMYAIKQALISREHSTEELDCAIFFIDVRAFGKDFERFYNRAAEEGIRFIRTRIPTVEEAPGTDDLELTYLDGKGRPVDERFDMVVLSVGMEISADAIRMAKTVGIELNADSFAESSSFSPVESSRPGIFTAGAFHAPQDIPSSVTDASAAAAQAGALLSEARFSLSKTKELPPELPHTDIKGARPRVGVFVCDCGTNIAGVVDVPQVARYAEGLPFVEYVAENLFSCSQDAQEAITQAVAEQRLNRVVVASCTPQTHEPLFQETVRGAGINKYLFEMANIRNQCSWVHAEYPEAATEKAKDLVRMAVEKVIRLEPLKETELEVTQAALVIGGGPAGMAAAKNLADQGYATYLIEKADSLGGNGLRLFQTWKREDIRSRTRSLINEITAHERIEVITNAEITSVEGFVGKFTTTITAHGQERRLAHGVTVIATGATELKPTEYGYGEDPRVVTSLELDELLAADDPRLREIETCVFIQCVGSRIPERPYCSRVCCTHSVMSALHLKEQNPKLRVFVLYRDIRTYGLREHVYKEAREKGVVFIRYDHEQELRVEREEESLAITFTDTTLKRKLRIDSDLLILAAAMVRDKEDRLSQLFKVPVNEDGFFVEAHVKLRPVEFATDGVFFCGLAHSPQAIDESIAQAQAAASRAVTVLSQKTIHSSGIVAVVNPLWCSSCGVCVAVCPYGAPSFNDKGVAEINPVLCKGCGLCTASCRSGAIHLNGFDEGQIMAMIESVSG